jgi:HTH-type transcriptional regulator, competence development regulator
MADDRQQQDSTNEEPRAELTAFGTVLRRYRKQRELTQEQVSWSSGVDRKFISRIELGQREPGLGTILKLVAALGVDFTEFMSAVDTEVKNHRALRRAHRRKKTKP